MKNTVLIVEDEPDWAELVEEILKKNGYKVLKADSADSALAKIKPVPPDLFILDINLRGVSGLKLCEILRADPATAARPILMLTSLTKEKDKVAGLKTGADDYLAKPFGRDELAARVMALLRRARPGEAPSQQLRHKDLAVDIDRHEVLVKGKAVDLRPKEFDLLVLLMRHPGRVMHKEFLAESIWGQDLIVTSQTLAQHVKNLRAKLGACADYVETVETLGYKFRE